MQSFFYQKCQTWQDTTHATIVVLIHCCNNTTMRFLLLQQVQQVQQWNYITKFKVYFAVIVIYQSLIFEKNQESGPQKFLYAGQLKIFRKVSFLQKNQKKFSTNPFLVDFFSKSPLFWPKISKKIGIYCCTCQTPFVATIIVVAPLSFVATMFKQLHV